MKRYALGTILFSLVLWGTGYAGDNQSSEREAVLMDEVVVSAGRVEEKRAELTNSVMIINEEAIANSSASNLGDLLAEKGAVAIRKYPGTLTSIGIRGFRTETHGNDLQGHVVILLDGRRIATGNAAKIMTKNVERVEIIRGPAAVQYGSAVVGGLVNVITKRGSEAPTFFAEGKTGSFGFHEKSVGFSGKMNQLDVSFAASRSEADDYDVEGGKKYRNTGYDSITNFSLNLGLEYAPGNRFGVVLTGYDADNVGNPEYLSGVDEDDSKDSKNSSVDFSWEGRTDSGRLSWNARYFQCKDRNRWSDPVASNPSFWDNGVPSEKETESKGSQAQISLNGDSLVVTTGLDWLNYEMTDDTYDPKKSEFTNTAAFVLARKKLLNERLVLSAGARYDMYDVEVKEPKGSEEDDTNFSPSVGIAYGVNEFLKVRANYSEAFVMPDAKHLASDFTSWGTRYVGNPDLDPESSKTWEAGLDIAHRAFTSSLTYFSTDFEDKISKGSSSGGDATWINLGGATISGLEGEFRGYIRNMLPFELEVDPYLSFSYLIEYEDDDTDTDLLYIPEMDISGGVTLTNLDGFSADLSVIYTAEQDVEDWESGTGDVVELDDSTVVNLTVTKRVFHSEKNGSISLRGEATNLFDEDYAYIKGYPMPGRAYYVSVRYDY